MRVNVLTAMTLGSLLVGCAPQVHDRTYDVYVSNHLADPVTVFVTKDGPPDEQGWLTPEMLAAAPATQDTKDNGRVVGPGFTAGAEKLTGKFEDDTTAVLRVYRATGGLETFCAISRGNPKRVETPLHPGRNDLVVDSDASGQITVQPTGK